jgi:Na+/H+ antiporter NhaA
VRIFLLTVSVVDDLAALVVIAVVYSDGLDATHLGIAGALLAVLLVASVRRVQRRWVYGGLGLAIWAAFLASGVDPGADRLGGLAGHRHHRRYRLYRGAADRRPRVLRR